MTTQMRISRGLNAQGQIVETPVEYDPDVVTIRRISRDTGQQARIEQASLEKQAVQFFIRGEAFPAELKDYHAALGDVLTASVGDAVVLPTKPAALDKVI